MKRKTEKEWLALFFAVLVLFFVSLGAFFWIDKIILAPVSFFLFIVVAFCFHHWRQEWAANKLEEMIMAPYR